MPILVQECRSYGALNLCVPYLPRVPYRALPSFHPGLCRSAALAGLISPFICVPRGSYRALPSFHPGLCRSAALAGLISPFICVSPGFHIGLCPHSTLGYAGVPPLQGSLSYWMFAVLCRGIVFVKCVWMCQWIVAFVRVFV